MNEYLIVQPFKFKMLNRDDWLLIKCYLEKCEKSNLSRKTLLNELEENFCGIPIPDLTEIDLLGLLIDGQINIF